MRIMSINNHIRSTLMHKIEVKHLQKQFQGHQILTDVSFSARSGEVVALLGGSGAGKSTLLRCLNLLEQPDSGFMNINGLTLEFPAAKISRQELISLRAKVGMVFQQFHLWPHLSILDNLIEAPLHALKQSKGELIEQAESLLNDVGILAKKNQFPGQLSGGQQQRAAIARALMMKPEVMLFDEPTSALDPQTVMALIRLVQSLAEKGMTIIVATHEMKFARELAHKTIFLQAGEILETGDTQHMFSLPKTDLFRQFIASVGVAT